MNLLKQELKANTKGFLCWLLGLLFLIVVAIVKFEGVGGTNAEMMQALLAQYPKILLAMFGMPLGVDITSLAGYNTMIAYYALMCACIYAITLGNHAVNREIIDKTYEFVFTKPIKRTSILRLKILGGFVPLTLFCMCNYVATLLSIKAFHPDANLGAEIALYALSTYVVALFFFMLTIFLSSICARTALGVQIAYMLFASSFLLGIAYDILEQNTLIRYFTPLRYFIYEDIAQHELNSVFLVISLGCIALFQWGAYHWFDKKDLSAS